jgi:5-methylcytosine-specific restriction protein A
MAHRACTEPRCPNFARPGSGKCDAHARAYERERSARRRAATKGVYKTKRWQATRRAVLDRDPLCKACGKRVAEEVDHVVPLEKDDSQPYALDGLQGLCAGCHRAKTARENAQRQAR